jgi:hypothetical protein
MKTHNITFATRIKSYLRKPFKEGACGPDAYDCVGLIYAFLKDSGKQVPDTFGCWDLDNYYTLARGNKIREKAILRDWLESLGEKVNNRLAGDLLLIQDTNNILFPAIYIGNCRCLTVIRERGVSVLFLDNNFTTDSIIRV